MTALVMELVEGDDFSQRIARGGFHSTTRCPSRSRSRRRLRPRTNRASSTAIETGQYQNARRWHGESPRLRPRESDGACRGSGGERVDVTDAVAAGDAGGNDPRDGGYMSPEQGRGKPVDKRTDIWAFGCVLFEMLAGRRAFEGDDVPEILSRVLQRDPDWARLPANLPPSIPKLLRLCLQKDVRTRRQSAGDVRIDLEQALVGSEQPPRDPGARHARGVGCGRSRRADRRSPQHSRVRYLREMPSSTPATRLVRLSILPPDKTLFTGFLEPRSARRSWLCPRGRAIVFVATAPGARPFLWLRSLDAVTAHLLPGTEGTDPRFGRRTIAGSAISLMES